LVLDLMEWRMEGYEFEVEVEAEVAVEMDRLDGWLRKRRRRRRREVTN
jgi:hypothetical protein